MELSEFIHHALVEIVQGIVKANEEIEKCGGSSLPHLLYHNATDIGMTSDDQFPITAVAFDLAVSTEQAQGTKAGIAILAGWFGAGAQGDSKQSAGAATRIQFSLPLRLPSPYAKAEKERAAQERAVRDREDEEKERKRLEARQ